MDIKDTPEEAEFRAEVRAFLDAHVPLLEKGETPAGMSERGDPDTVKKAQEWQACKKDSGWACLTWPVEYGGRDVSPIQNVIWNQEEARYRTAPNLFSIGTGMLGPTLINGQKTWTTGAQYSEWGMIVTRTDPSVPKHAGLTYFIVDMKAPGVEIRPIKQINGGSGFNEVFFSDARIPDSYRLDAVGNGWAVALTTLMNERASIGGGGGGFGAEELIRLAQDVEIDGRPAIEDSMVRQRIADFYVRATGLRFTGYRTLTALSRGTTPGPESSIGKLVGAPMGQEISAFGVERQGMAGGVIESEYGCQASYLGSPGIRIAGGTDEVMRNILAERVLRLPPEPRVDKKIAFKDIPTGPPNK